LHKALQVRVSSHQRGHDNVAQGQEVLVERVTYWVGDCPLPGLVTWLLGLEQIREDLVGDLWALPVFVGVVVVEGEQGNQETDEDY